MGGNRIGMFWLEIGAAAAALGLGCAETASSARSHAPNRPMPAYVVSPPARATVFSPVNPQAYQVPATPPRSASNATTAGAQASDFRPLALSSRGDRREAVAWQHTMPSAPTTVPSAGQPLLGTELRTGLKPTMPQPPLAADFARPITDRGRYAGCGLPEPTRLHVQATIYDGSTVTVDVNSTPNNAALDQCIVNAVRQISWARNLSVRNVDVTF
jgi:hypothetical protein